MWPKKVAIDFQIPLAVILTIPPFNYPVNLAVSKFTVEQGERVLVTAPTNAVVDNMVEKLSKCWNKYCSGWKSSSYIKNSSIKVFGRNCKCEDDNISRRV
jgi:hypothetical protein